MTAFNIIKKRIACTPITIACLLLIFSSGLYAQENIYDLSDTSYFIAGDDNSNLIRAITRNYPVHVSLLLSRGTDPDAVSYLGKTALIHAVEIGNTEFMQSLVEYGANVNAPGRDGETALLVAIFKNDFEAAQYLLDQGADPNMKDAFGITPLLYASAMNQYQLSDLLLFYQADPAIRDSSGNDALMTAVTFDHLETSDVLLQNGLDPDTRDSEENTPLIVSVQHGNYVMLDLLLDYKADVNIVNSKNYSPLAYAVTYEDIKATKILLENGADVHHSIDENNNIAELARIIDNDSISMLISEYGGVEPPGTDFSEYRFVYGNSFNSTDYLIRFGGEIADTKMGFFFGTGIDYRPFLLKVQTEVNDSTFQFRERRIGWSQSIGKDFKLLESKKGLKLSVYTSLNGFLSFPQYAGTSKDPGISYKIFPSAGLVLSSRYVGVKAGADWYHFESELDRALKYNVTFFLRIVGHKVHYDWKEINWD